MEVKINPCQPLFLPSCEQHCFKKKVGVGGEVECARNVKFTARGREWGGDKIPGMLQNTNILKQARFLMYRLLPVNCTDETLKARQ